MRKLLVIFSIVLISLTACSTASDEGSTAEILLSQNYTASFSNGSLSLDYPDGWFVSGDFPELGILIASNNDLILQPFEGTVTGDDVFVDIVFIPEDRVEDPSPEAVLQSLIDAVENPEGTVSEIESRTINGKNAAIVTLDAENGSDGIQIVIDSGDAFSLVLVAVADGNIEAQQATAEAIAGSIDYIREATTEATVDTEMTSDVEMTTEATESSE